MKKIILMVFLVLGVMSFSAMDKVIIVVQNDNYETPFITGTYSRGMLADTLFSGSKDSGVGESIYNQVYKTDKITFVIEKSEDFAAFIVFSPSLMNATRKNPSSST
jgi:hypothetical protein